MNGRYIVLEGQDATGKSTLANRLAEHYRRQGRKVVVMHEPDGDLPSAKVLRTLLKKKAYDLDPHSLVLLFTAARNELWRKLAEPCLAKDGVVISARNWWSTLAYQGYGFGIDLGFIEELTRKCLPERYVSPDWGVILVLDDAERDKRRFGREYDSSKDTYESQCDDFQRAVTNSYYKIAKKYRVPVMDASPPPDELFRNVLKLFMQNAPD